MTPTEDKECDGGNRKQCNALDGCKWAAGFCLPEGQEQTPAPTAGEAADPCAAPNMNRNKCKAAGCLWGQGKCTAKEETDDPCEGGNNRPNCNKIEGCKWNAGLKECLAPGGGGDGGETGCAANKARNLCSKATGCEWVGSNKKGSCQDEAEKGTPTDCDKKTNKRKCEAAFCSWTRKQNICSFPKRR